MARCRRWLHRKREYDRLGRQLGVRRLGQLGSLRRIEFGREERSLTFRLIPAHEPQPGQRRVGLNALGEPIDGGRLAL
jgi:hypothetical protein